MAAADVELIVHHVGARHVIGDHSQAVAAVGPGSSRDFLAADNTLSGGRRRIQWLGR